MKANETNATVTMLARDLNISHNSIRRFIRKHEKELRDYVELIPVISSTRIEIKDYKGLKAAIVEMRQSST